MQITNARIEDVLGGVTATLQAATLQFPVGEQADQRQLFISASGDDSFDVCPTCPGNLVSLARNQYPTCT
jgi:hypothetical protein